MVKLSLFQKRDSTIKTETPIDISIIPAEVFIVMGSPKVTDENIMPATGTPRDPKEVLVAGSILMIVIPIDVSET